MRAGLVGLTEVHTADGATRLTSPGECFRVRLNGAAAEFGAPLHATGLGSILNIHGQRGPITRPEQVATESAALKGLLSSGSWPTKSTSQDAVG